jgi:N-acetylneuraminic acid mutarotase
MCQARPDVGVAVVNGKIYAIGGGRNLTLNEEYDPATDKWIIKQPMPTARYNFGIAVYNSKIYCFGGQYNSDPMSKAIIRDQIEVYDPSTDTWETKKPMAEPRTQLQANTASGKIFLMGEKQGDN